MTTFDYTSRDYFAIRQDLLSRAEQVLPEWTSRDDSDFGVMLVDLWAYMGDILHYYIDRAAREAFLETATRRESVLAIANLLDYVPSGRRAATAQINLNAAQSVATDTSPILIPAGTRFIATPLTETDEPVIFTVQRSLGFNTTGATVDGYLMYPKSTVATVSLLEGESFSEVFVSNGAINQRFTLARIGIVFESIEITVAEGVGSAPVEYGFVTRLVESSNTDKVFSTTLSADETTTVVFGNDVNGKIPTTNAVITINYRTSRGAAGNVEANSITEFESLVNSFGPAYDGIVVIPNTVRALGGSDSESITSLKTNISTAFRAQDRAVSVTDYEDLVLRVPGIVKSKALALPMTVAKTGSITNKQLSASVATLTTAEDHGLLEGETIAIFNVDEVFDGTHIVTAGTSGSTITFDLNSANVASASVASDATFKNAQVMLYALTNQAVYDGTLPVDPTTGPIALDPQFRDSIYDYLAPREMIGVNTVVMPSVSLTNVSVEVTLNVLPNYVQAAVSANVQAAIKSLFTFDNVGFEQVVTLGELYRTILAVPGVDYSTVDRMSTSATTGEVIDVVAKSPVVKGVTSDPTTLLLLTDLVINASGGITTA